MILKTGDDLRLDVAVLRIFACLNCVWRAAGLTLRLLPVVSLVYGAVAVSNDIGFIQMVPECISLSGVSKYQGMFSPSCLDRLITTASGSYMAAYIIGVRDRHYDNILVSLKDGSLFHIDFANILGNAATIDTAPLAITKDLQLLLGPGMWTEFVELSTRAFMVLRKQAHTVIGVARMLMSPFRPAHEVEEFVRARLFLNRDKSAAMARIRAMLERAPTEYKTTVKNAVHGLATSISGAKFKPQNIGKMMVSIGRASRAHTTLERPRSGSDKQKNTRR